jgi:hypothetical protein
MPKQFKQMMSAIKLMATVFWDRKGVLIVELTQQGTTLTSKVHCETLKELCRAIQDKRNGMLISNVVLLHDIQLLVTEHCWSTSTASQPPCLTTLLTGLILL